jgi:recombinational DNA repair protein RecR
MSDMFNLPPAIQELKSALNKLPSIGPRSAERIALHIVQCKQDPIRKLIESIQEAKEKIALCEKCGGLTESQPCSLCSIRKGKRIAFVLLLSQRISSTLKNHTRTAVNTMSWVDKFPP